MAFAPPARHLLRAKDLADARYSEPVTVAHMAGAAGLSKAHFSREFSRTFGESPHHYLLTRRLERAASLLRMTDWTVGEICVSVGLVSLGSFTTSFKRAFGETPTQYRANQPPASLAARVPSCVLRTYTRPQAARFKKTAGLPLTSLASNVNSNEGESDGDDQGVQRADLGARPG